MMITIPSVRREVKMAAPITNIVSWGSITAAWEKALVAAVEPDIFVLKSYIIINM